MTKKITFSSSKEMVSCVKAVKCVFLYDTRLRLKTDIVYYNKELDEIMYKEREHSVEEVASGIFGHWRESWCYEEHMKIKYNK